MNSIVIQLIIELHEFARWFVRLGEYDVTTTTDGRHVDIVVREWKKHTEFEPNLLLNDIGMILLERDVVFNGKSMEILKHSSI